MSPKRKNGAAAKPPAQPKPSPSTAKPPAVAPATASKPPVAAKQAPQPIPARPPQPSSSSGATSSTQRVSPQPPAGPPKPGVTIQANPVAPPPKTLSQPAKHAAQPAKSALASHLRNVFTPAAKLTPAQKHTFTRSDRVRAEWNDFEQTWVLPHQAEIEMELQELAKAAERTSRSKDKKGTPNGMDKIVNAMQREFALAARAEWDARLRRANLQAEEWVDMTPDEMLTVEQVLSYEESDEETGVYALAQHASVAGSANSSSTAIGGTTPPAPSKPLGGWQSRSSAPLQSSAAQKAKAGQPLHSTQPVASRPVPGDVLEPLKKQTPASLTSSIREDHRTQARAPVTSTPVAAATPATATASSETDLVLLAYSVPVALSACPLPPSHAADAEYMQVVEKLYLNSIRQFHLKAADADAELARQLRKPMPTADREFTIRAHQMAMEQSARDIVKRRDELLADERKKRGLGGPGGDSAPPSTVQVPSTARPLQPPGAFPEERTQPVKRTEPTPAPEPILEYVPNAPSNPEPEPEPEVDEVIEVPIKGKGKKKGKKVAVAETKPVANGRSTPTPGAAPASTPAASGWTSVLSQKTPAPAEPKSKPAVPALSTLSGGKSSTPTQRAASPAPINTKLAANGRNSPAPKPSSSTPSPWETYQGKANAAQTTTADQKAAAVPNGIWAPPMARATSSNKNPFAPSRPSRLAQVTQAPDVDPVPQSPESPEPPSPPPQEPSGRDYVAWFAGSSSEDEESASADTLDEDEDDDDDEEEESGGASFGGLLASLAGNSPWALFGGENSQPQRGRAASPARGRGATPTPTRIAAARFTPAPDAEPAYARWGMPSAGPSGLAAAAPTAPPGMWKEDDGDLDQMLELASSALDKAAMGTTRPGVGGVNIEEAMAMYVTASKARETLATPVGGRSGWRR
ncbi:hypothetical protein C8Q73DRAFT_643125 [Cubamyces lactineus]|nr:hypothetical protein C8Q73DRAFT_643125 [Cubamyces lactineus]